MKTRKNLAQMVLLLGLLTLNFTVVLQQVKDVKIGVILPKKNKEIKEIETKISRVIDELNKKCHPSFIVVNKWYYSSCDEAATQAIDASTKQVKILFSEGCFDFIKNAIKEKEISQPYPISSNMNPIEIKKYLNDFCQSSKSSTTSKSLPRYIINVSSALLHAQIPVDKQGNYLPNMRENVVAKLTQGDIVVEKEKDDDNPRYRDDDNRPYKEDVCKKSIQFEGEERLAWYDWSQTRDWLCVTIQSNNPSLQNKAGWIHRLLIRPATD